MSEETKAAPLDSLQAMLAALPAAFTPRTETFDVSDVMSAAPGTWVYTFRELDTAELFKAGKDGGRLMMRNPDWTQEHAGLCALMAWSHQSPTTGGTSRLDFYEAISKRSPALYFALLQRFQAAFPQQTSVDAAKEAAGEV